MRPGHTAIDDDLVSTVARLLAAEAGEPTESARQHVLQLAPLLPPERHEAVVAQAVAEVTGLGQLQEYVTDPEVDEVMVNGAAEVWVDRAGHLSRVAALSARRVDALVERILAPLGRRLDRASPIVDARLPDGSRVCAVTAPVAVDGTCLCIRKFRARPVPLTEFGADGVVALLHDVVAARCNVLVTGATSAGKTTLLNALTALVGPEERIITLEDTAELQLHARHVVRLEARPAGADGPPPVELHHLVRAALRLRPDRLVIGEVRGPEALDLLQALNTGHDGSLATLHANSARDAVRRVTAMVLQGGALPADVLHDLVRSAIDVIVHVTRQADGRRTIHEVVELNPPGQDGPPVNTLYEGGMTAAPLHRRREVSPC